MNLRGFQLRISFFWTMINLCQFVFPPASGMLPRVYHIQFLWIMLEPPISPPFSGSLQPLRFRGTAELLIGIASVLSFQRIRGAACLLAQSGPSMLANGRLRFCLDRTDLSCPSVRCRDKISADYCRVWTARIEPTCMLPQFQSKTTTLVVLK